MRDHRARAEEIVRKINDQRNRIAGGYEIPPDEPGPVELIADALAQPAYVWSSDKPTAPGWWWVQWTSQPFLGPEILGVTQPNGPDTDYLEVADMPLDEYLSEYGPCEWAGPIPVPKEGEP